jgi:mono/diheme cytochrome c family protein
VRGKQMFEGACASCHGWTGVSELSPYATLTGSRALNDPSGMNVAQMVISGSGSGSFEGSPNMPAFGDSYSNAEIADVVNYVTARFGSQPSSLAANDVAKFRGKASQ